MAYTGSMPKNIPILLKNIRLDKLVHGGHCLATSPDGRKLFVWGGIPGEVVNVQLLKQKSSYLEGVVNEVIVASTDRVEPKEPDVYLSSSPWQIMNFRTENKAKQAILEEAFLREGIRHIPWQNFYSGKEEYGYRNKIEVGFWGDEEGVHYASYVRSTHSKQVISKNVLAQSAINAALPTFMASMQKFIRKHSLRAGDFKTVVFRCSMDKKVAAALYCKKELGFHDFELPSSLQGIVFYYSNPKSPASVSTKKLHIIGDILLTDSLLGINITYDITSFFQVNIPVFEAALSTIKNTIGSDQSVDFYSGVGAIGLTVGSTKLIESNHVNVAMAKLNAAGTHTEVVGVSAELATEHIDERHFVIVDPPRAGLQDAFIKQLLTALPPKVVYLSCNPSTQARDVKLLLEKYNIVDGRGFNFFPRTPHIESLVVLELR